MEKDIDIKKSDEDLDKLLNEKNENLQKIIDYLNKLINLVDGEYAVFFNQTVKDNPFLYKIIKTKLEDLKSVLMEEYSLKHFCLMIYELLFIGPIYFNFDNFKSKSHAFELVLNILNNDLTHVDEEKQYINDVINTKNVWKSFIDKISIKLPGFTLIFCVFIKYFQKNEQIIQFLIDFIQGLTTFSIRINFNLKDLNDMNENNIAKDFLTIFSDKTKYFELVYDNGHIIKKLLTEDEKIKAQEEEEVNIYLNEKNEDLIRKNPNILIRFKSDNHSKNDIKEKNISNEERAQKTSNENQSIKTDLKPVTKIKLEESKKSDENKHKIEEDEGQMNLDKKESKIENGKISNDLIVNDNKSLIEEIQNLKMEIKELNKKVKLHENIFSRSKEKHNKYHQKEREKINELTKRLDEVEYNLNWIKSRDAIESFIDYFYNGLGLAGEYDYREKASQILYCFNNYNDLNKNDITLFNTLRLLMKKGADKLYIENDLSHKLNISEKWLLDLFEFIQPDGKYENIVKKFSSVNADCIIMKSIQNRSTNYKDKTLLEEVEKNIFSNVSAKEIKTILFK